MSALLDLHLSSKASKELDRERVCLFCSVAQPSVMQTDSQQEIPESVTAELEKLEQEVEVSAILADLGDDDELLGEWPDCFSEL
jgi:hypothetical protein